MAVSNHTMFLTEDGTVRGVGTNTSGQLGIGNTTNQSTIQTISITGVKQISCGEYYTMFLMRDGTVRGVGTNTSGQLGIGNTTIKSTIQTIPITGVKEISCGGNHTMFLMEDGTVRGVGHNIYGQLGIGNVTNQSTIQTIPITGVKQISCGGNHTMFLMEDGTVRGVGYNTSGQLGTGNTTNQSTIQTILITGVKQISCGTAHTIFLMEDGTVKGVGRNAEGQLGLGNTNTKFTIQTIPITGVKQISCGTYHTMFIMEDGTVKGVGSNNYGQLGTGNTTDQSTIQTIPITGVKQISCGGAYTMFLMEDGTVKGVGYNLYGQLGLGNTTNPISTIQTIPINNVIYLDSTVVNFEKYSFIFFDNKYLISRDNLVWEELSISNLSEQNFINFGMTSKKLSEIPKNLWEQLNTNFELITFIPELDRQTIQIDIDGSTSPLDELDENFELLEYNSDNAVTSSLIELNNLPVPQLIVAKGDIDLSNVYTINSFTTTVNEINKGKVYYALSVDEGQTWQIYNGTGFIQLTELSQTTIVEAKMDTTLFNSISASMWNTLISETKKIRFAYYLEIKDMNDIVEVDDLTLTYQNKGIWHSAIQGEDFTYSYPSNEKMTVKIFKDGDYKFNYYKPTNVPADTTLPDEGGLYWEEFDF